MKPITFDYVVSDAIGQCLVVDQDGEAVALIAGATVADQEMAMYLAKAANHHDNLVDLLSQLLGCVELNMHDLTSKTLKVVHEAGVYLADNFNQ